MTCRRKQCITSSRAFYGTPETADIIFYRFRTKIAPARTIAKMPTAVAHLPQLLGAAAGLDGEALEHEEQAAAVDEEAQRGGDADERQEDAAGDAARLHQPPVRQHAERPQPHLNSAELVR